MDSLRAQTINRDHSTDPPEVVEGLLDINILPDRYRPGRISLTTVFAWLMFLVLVGVLYLSFQRFQQGTQALAEQRLRFQAAQEAMDAAEVQPAEIESLQTEIQELEQRSNELESAAEQINIQSVQWGGLLADIVLDAPDGVRLTTINQEAGQVTITGVSDEYGQPLAYRDELKGNEALTEVRLLSIARIPAEDLELTGTATATPTEQAEQEATTEEDDLEQFLYQFEIQLQVPDAIQATPTPEVTQ